MNLKKKTFTYVFIMSGFPGGSAVRNQPAVQEMQFHSGSGTSLEKETASHSAVFFPGKSHREESVWLRSMGSQRVDSPPQQLCLSTITAKFISPISYLHLWIHGHLFYSLGYNLLLLLFFFLLFTLF